MSASLQLQPIRKPLVSGEYPVRPWADSDDKNLVRVTYKNATMPQMMKALKRSEKSIRRRCVALKINLDYLNQPKD